MLKLAVALDSFESGHRKFATADREKIMKVINELDLDDADFIFIDSYFFDTHWRSYKGFTASQQNAMATIKYVYEHEIQGTIRIHPTMIVAKKSFNGSEDRGLKPYPFHRHHYKLSGWVDKDGSSGGRLPKVREVLCPKLFILVPVGNECQCGEQHFKPNE
jgi:hypothetical protein